MRAYLVEVFAAGFDDDLGAGDSYDNTLAETVIGLYKAEVIHRHGPWRSFEAVESRPWNGLTGSTIAG